MLKEALQFLIQKGVEENPLVETGWGLYSKVPLNKVRFPELYSLEVNTLTSLIDFLKDGADDLLLPKGKFLIHVVSPSEVKVLMPLNDDCDRECVLRAKAILPDNIHYTRFIDTEQFNIMLQSSFVNKGDKELLLKFTGLIKDESVKETGDNGISQKVTIKTGVATVGDAVVPNPVTLAPYRTFMEIEQVQSQFIFRMKDGPVAALFEADGGAWKNKTMNNIKTFIEDSLKGSKVSFDVIA